MRKTLLLSALLCLPSIGIAGDLERDLKKCTALDSDKERLACFDLVNNKYDLMGNLTSLPDDYMGNWKIESTMNPLDDTVTAVAYLASTNLVGEQPAAMVIRCKSKKLDMFVSWNHEMSKKVKVISRLGDDKPEVLRWFISEDYRSTFKSKPEYILKKMQKVDSVVLQTGVYKKPTVTATFDVRGMSNALKEINKACDLK